MMDSNSEDEDYENTEQTSHHESAKYKVMYPRDRKQKGWDESLKKKKYIFVCMS